MTIEIWNNFGKVIKTADYDTSGDKDAKISQLPDEVFLLIFNNADAQDSVNIVLTCRRWYLIGSECRLPLIEQTMQVIHIEGRNLEERIHRAIAVGRREPQITILQQDSFQAGIGQIQYFDSEGIYMQMDGSRDNKVYYFSGNDGTIEPTFTLCSWIDQERFSDMALFSPRTDSSIDVLEPHSGKLLYTLPSIDKEYYAYKIAVHGSQLFSVYSDGNVRLWNLSTQEILFQKKFESDEITSFSRINFDGKHIILVHDVLSDDRNSIQFSCWELNKESLTQLEQWDSEIQIRSGHHTYFPSSFYFEQSHMVVVGGRSQLCRYNFLDKKEEKQQFQVLAEDKEYISKICRAGDDLVVFHTMNAGKEISDPYTGKLYEWKIIQNKITLVYDMENDAAQAIHVIGRQIIVTSFSTNLYMIDRNTKSKIWQMKGEFSTWQISYDVMNRGSQFAGLFYSSGENRSYALAKIDFGKPAEEQKESSTS